MKLPINLRFRFGLWTGAVVFLAVLVHGAVLYTTMSLYLNGAILDKLRFSADQVIAAMEMENGTLVPPDFVLKSDERETLGETTGVRVFDPLGKQVFAEGPVALIPGPILEALKTPVYRTLEPDLAVWAVPVKHLGAVVGLVEVAQSTAPAERILEELLFLLLVLLPVFLLGSAFGGAFLATRLMRPIDAMTKTARRFSAEDLSARLGLPQNDDEFGRLASTFDEMLARIELSFVRQRQFTADASHELRTPVSVIQSIITVTRRRRRSAEEYEEALDDLGMAADRLESLVTALMSLARTDSAAPPMAAVEVDVLVRNVVDSLRPLAHEKQLRLEAQVSPGLTTRADSDGLTHVLVNLIHNALTYTTEGGVSVTARQKNQTIELKVEDTGLGIAEEHLPRIFDRFYRVDPSRTIQGSGLGLAIARVIVERHGGSIEAESTPGKGTVIRVLLPILN